MRGRRGMRPSPNTGLTATWVPATVTAVSTTPGWLDFDGLTSASDISPADWLLERFLPFGDPRIGALVPSGYEAYARVLPPIYSYVDGVTTKHCWRDIARVRGIALTPSTTLNELVGWDIYTHGQQPPAPYQQPAWGDVDDDDLAALADVLGGFTATAENCWFALWEGYGWNSLPAPGEGPPRWRAPNRDYLLFKGSVAAATGFRYGEQIQAPTIWWPDDRAWCVATDIDCYRTYIAASAAAIDALLKDPRLEIMAVNVNQDADTSPYHPPA